MSRQTVKSLFGLFFALVLFVTVIMGGQVILPAFADGVQYTDVLEDLRKDGEFNADEYPEDVKDHSLKVIQIAESSAGELFVYTYQPSAGIKARPATSINISTAINDSYSPKNYKLSLLSADGVLSKYLVEELTVKGDALRYYEIPSIFRAWDGEIDAPPAEGSGNTINEVSYEVAQLWTACTVNGEVSYKCTESEVIVVTDKYVGQFRYEDGYWLFGNNATDSHYVAFSVNRDMEELLEAEVYYVSQEVEEHYAYGIKTTTSRGDEVQNYVLLTRGDTASNPRDGWWFSKEHTWGLIETVEELKAEETITDELAENLKGKEWVLRFAATSYKKEGDYKVSRKVFTEVSNVTILRLKFEKDGKVFNLGVVDNKQEGSHVPDNPPDGAFDLFSWLESVTGIPALVWKIIAALIPIAILFPVLSVIFPPVGKFLLWLLKGLAKGVAWLFSGLWWLVCLPFKGIAAAIRKHKERK